MIKLFSEYMTESKGNPYYKEVNISEFTNIKDVKLDQSVIDYFSNLKGNGTEFNLNVFSDRYIILTFKRVSTLFDPKLKMYKKTTSAIDITQGDDEWFKVTISIHSRLDHYLCDQFEGLTSLLKDLNFFGVSHTV